MKVYLRICICLSIMGMTLSVFGQNAVKDEQFNSWWTYSGNHKINEKWDVHTMYSFRRNDFVKNWQQSLLRLGLGYKLGSGVKIQAGYDWARTFPYGKQPVSYVFDEHRPWEQITWGQSLGRVKLKYRARLEQRFLEKKRRNTEGEWEHDKFKFENRIRFKVNLDVPLNKAQMQDGTLFFRVNDELFMNTEMPSIFDQNWFFTGFGWRFNAKRAVVTGYFNQFIAKRDQLHFESNHTWSTTFIWNF